MTDSRPQASFALRRRGDQMGWHVLVDGVDVAKHVTSLVIRGERYELFTVELELMFLNSLDIDLPSAIIEAIQVPIDTSTIDSPPKENNA